LAALLADVSRFFEKDVARLRVSAPLLNLHGPPHVPVITFPGDVILRPTTDEEVTQFYGGDPFFQRPSQTHLALPDFVLCKDVSVPKVVGRPAGEVSAHAWQEIRDTLERCVIALSTFKDGGAIGYDGIFITPAELLFGPGSSLVHLSGADHVPFAYCPLMAEEAPALQAHVAHFQNLHEALEMACHRLVDAARRPKPQDSIVDAVIGLEAILLFKDREGEKRFRFSAHYASLFPVRERLDAFKTARSLYDLRSTVAHGARAGASVDVGDKKLTLHEAAALARSILRSTVDCFLPCSSNPDFVKQDYWLSRTLGLDPGV
jgi:hypothetical protein